VYSSSEHFNQLTHYILVIITSMLAIVQYIGRPSIPANGTVSVEENEFRTQNTYELFTNKQDIRGQIDGCANKKM